VVGTSKDQERKLNLGTAIEKVYDPPTSVTRKKMRASLKFLLTLIILIASLVLVLLLIFVTTSYTYEVEGDSMLPSLHNGDRVLVNRMLVSIQKPQRGDLVVFEPPTEPRDFIKRVIATEGDRVEIKADPDPDGRPSGENCGNCGVFVNGVRLDEPYIKQSPDYSVEPITIPQGHIFVLGDNRRNSSDSHIWGPLDLKSVRAKALP
jgi:signal peptidase I